MKASDEGRSGSVHIGENRNSAWWTKGFPFKPGHSPRLSMVWSVEIETQASEIEMPPAGGSQINSELRATNAENSCPARDRLSHLDVLSERKARRGREANSLGKVGFVLRDEREQAVPVNPDIASMREDAVNDPSKAGVRCLNADRESMETHRIHTPARRMRSSRTSRRERGPAVNVSI
jgi:hypothetical protein